ncbi:sporulation initiation factor Spo0A C-terminal domain-containing protein [uncultured Eubacterium sp.]|uniref:sporulation initiation factor Spo0A C-terminal domain-containing protein n=1 Tax=uncultured Eubacterium sp. TaxID=165185 RepID=UPI0032652BC0
MDKQKKIAIVNTLDQIGMKHSLKGYGYSISSIEKCLADRALIHCVCKGIYADIAAENNDTVSRVERAMRHAIECVWENGNTIAINKIFGYTVSARKGKPTNSEFIATITDFISLNYKEIADGTYNFD